MYRYIKSTKIYLIFLHFLLISQAFGMEPIDTDGPDFVESSEVVPKDYFQYELGFGANSTSKNLEQSSGYETPLLMRYGVNKNFEVRVQSDGYMYQNGEKGIGTTAFGFKYQSNSRNLRTGAPAIAWIVHLETPLASSKFRNNGVLPSIRSVITWDLKNNFSLGIMPGLSAQTNISGERFTAGIFGAVLGKKLTNKTRIFVEISAPTISNNNQNGIIISSDLGAAYLLSNDTQIGFRAGKGLNNNSPKQYIVFELAQRY